jgi:hypothetical protein
MNRFCLLPVAALLALSNLSAEAAMGVSAIDGTIQSAPPTAASPIASNTPDTAQDSGKLHIVWAPAYLWMTGLNGNIGVKGYAVPVNASFSDVFSNLNLGYMGAVDIRKRRIGALVDVVYSKLTTKEVSTPFGLLYGGVKTTSKTFFIDPEFYGRIIEKPKYTIDGFAGVRIWNLDNSLNLRAGLLPALSLDQTESWADPLLGGRIRVNLPRGFFATLKGDVGIGENETWQIYTGGGKEFKNKYAVILAYRRLDVDRRTSSFLFDTSMNGLLLGMTIRLR